MGKYMMVYLVCPKCHLRLPPEYDGLNCPNDGARLYEERVIVIQREIKKKRH